jgi:hypothetical protein
VAVHAVVDTFPSEHSRTKIERPCELYVYLRVANQQAIPRLLRSGGESLNLFTTILENLLWRFYARLPDNECRLLCCSKARLCCG